MNRNGVRVIIGFGLLLTTVFVFSQTVYSANCSWTGAIDTDWHNAGNWTSCGGLEPQTADNATVTNVANLPTLTLVRTIHNLTINSSATLTINNDLTLDGQPTTATLTNNGTIGGSGTIITQNTVTISNGANTFTADLNIDTGTTTVGSSTFSSGCEITIDSSATFNVGSGVISTVNDNVINNGTLSGNNSGSTLLFNGATFTNNNSVTVATARFDSTSSIVGTGTWTGAFFRLFGASADITLGNDMTVASTNSILIDSGSQLDLGGFTLTRPGNTFTASNSSSVINGTLLMQNTNTLTVSATATFTVDLNIDTGTTNVGSSTFDAGCEITIDGGAIFNVGSGVISRVNDNLINNGTLSGNNSGSTLLFNGATFTNNNSVTVATARFDSTSNIVGTGTWTGGTFRLFGASADITLGNDMTVASTNSILIDSGSQLDLGGFTLTRPGNTFTASNSSSVINGTLLMQNTNTLTVSATATFTVDLNIDTGTTNVGSSTFDAGCEITIDGGAIFNVGSGVISRVNDNLINNGTLSGNNSGSILLFNGATFTNNNSVTVANVRFDSTSSIVGTGTWTGSTFRLFGTSAVVTLGNNLTVASTNTFIIDSGSQLDLGGFTLTRTGISLTVSGTASVTNGTLRTQGTITLSINSGATFTADLNVNTGTTNVGSSVFDAGCEITIDNGAIFSVGAGVIATVNDNVINNGTLTGGNTGSTLEFNGGTFTNNDSVTVANFDFSSDGEQFLTGTGSFSGINDILVEGTTTLSVISDHQVEIMLISSGTTLKLQTGVLTFNTSLTFNHNSTIERSDGSLASAPTFVLLVNLIYSGTNPIITGFELPTLNTTLDDLTMNNSSGVTLNADAFVNGSLNLNSANILTGANTLNMRSAATSNRTAGHVIGTMLKTYSSAGVFTFDLGTANGYSPITVETTAGTHPLNFTISAIQGPQPALTASIVLQRYWDISHTSNPTADLTFNYLQTDVMGTESLYSIIRVTGGIPTAFMHNPPAVDINTTTNVAKIEDVTTFSDWTLGQLAPTAASVPIGGRVFDSANGKPVYKALVRLVDTSGQIRYAMTNPFGYYRFTDVSVAETYTISVKHKSHQFRPQVISVDAENFNFNFWTVSSPH